MNLDREAKGRDQDHLVVCKPAWMDMTLAIRGESVFQPAPGLKRLGIKLEASAWSWKAAIDVTVLARYLDANTAPTIWVSVGRGQGNDIRTDGLGACGEDAAQTINVQPSRQNRLRVDRFDVLLDCKSAIATHLGQRREALGSSLFREPWD